MSRVSILFNTEMVQAILDGRKTCMREAVKLPKHVTEQDNGLYTLFADGTCYENQHMEELMDYLQQPYQLGDILYVRETWKKYCKRVGKGEACHIEERFAYKADYGRHEVQKPSEWYEGKWKPSTNMPKEAARIWLKVTNVRAERLQEITNDECVAEGIYPSNCRGCNATFGCDICPHEGYDEVDEFTDIWNSTIKKSNLDRYGWDANPYVWVASFERCKKPDGIYYGLPVATLKEDNGRLILA